MVRISVLWVLVILVTIGVMVSVSFADNNEVKSTDLKKVKREETDRSISKLNDHDDDDDGEDKDSDGDHDHDNDNDDHDHDNDNDDHDNDDDDHDNDDDDHANDDNDHDNDNDGEDDDDGDNEDDGDGDGDGDDDDDDEEKKTLGVHELKKGNLTVKFTNRGASIMSLLFPNKHGIVEDIVLAFLDTTALMTTRTIFTVKKHNHNSKKPYIVFTYTSPDHGDQGKLEVSVTYKLVGENKLKMVMEAKAKEKTTPVNLVHRSYWNLGGRRHNDGDIYSEEIQILGSGYAHLDDNLTPTGKILSVKGTPYDFRQLRPIEANIINELKKTGFGINYCLDGVANKMRKVVELVDKKSKIRMELSTDQSGLRFYTGGRSKNNKGNNGSVRKAYTGLCLESHAINYKYLPLQMVEPGKTNYKHTMLFKFSIVP